MIRVVIADDHPIFREGLRFTLEQADDIAVVGEASDGRQVLALVAEHDPDVVVMDLAMPEMDGISATERLAQTRSRVLVLTFSEDDASVLAALRAGALGYVRKGADSDQVISAVRATAAGHGVFGPGIASRMLEGFSVRSRSARDRFPDLSPREVEILERLAQGKTNQEIGSALFISPITVRNHVSNILSKLQLSNRREAMLRFHAEDVRGEPGSPHP